MSRQIADNLSYKGQQFLDERVNVQLESDFQNLREFYYPNGFLAFCNENECYYAYNEDNAIHPVTGKWKKLGSLVYHDEGVNPGLKKPNYFITKMGTINAGSSVPTESNPGAYWTIDPAQSVPFQIASYIFTRKNQCLYRDINGNLMVTMLPSETDVHVFQDPSVSFYKRTEASNAEPAYIYNKYGFSAKAMSSGLFDIFPGDFVGGANVKYAVRDKFLQNGAEVRLGDWCYESADPNFVISATNISYTHDGNTEVIEFADLDVKKVKSFESAGLVKRVMTATLFCSDPTTRGGYLVHIKNNKSFDSYANITEQPIEVENSSISEIPLAHINDLIATENLELNDGNMYLIGVYGTELLAYSTAVKTSTTPSGWVFDAEGYWRKIFPADIALDPESQAPVANGIVTRSIAKAGHSVKVEFEPGIKVLTVALNDKDGNELNRMAVSIGEDDSAAPKAELSVEEDLYDKNLGVQDVDIKVHAVKGNNDIKKIEIKDLITNTVIKTFEGADIEPDAQEKDYEYTYSSDVTLNLEATIYDADDVTGTSNRVPVDFVMPCKFNPDGQSTFLGFDDYLTRDGFCKILFNFGDNIAQPTYLIPTDIYADHPVTAIIGGNTEEEMYTNYIDSFTHDQYTDAATGTVYERFYLTTPCNLVDYFFEFRVENN